MAFENGEQTPGRPACLLQEKEAVDRTLKSVRRFWPTLGQANPQVRTVRMAF